MRKVIMAASLLVTVLLFVATPGRALLGDGGCISVPVMLKNAWFKCGEVAVGTKVEVHWGYGCVEGTKKFCESTCLMKCYIYNPNANYTPE